MAGERILEGPSSVDPFPIMPARARGPGAASTRVMVCDDSAVIRSILCRVLAADENIQVVARATNGRDAVEQIRAHPTSVDVLVLDIEMPVMDGLEALPLLMSASPALRVIMASTLTTRGAGITLEAMRLGAVDYIPKPSAGALTSDASFQRELLRKVLGLGRTSTPKTITATPTLRLGSPPILLAIGSSTGGPAALVSLLQALQVQAGARGIPVPVVLTQHMPATFTPLLAQQIERLCGLPCAEATHDAPLLAGRLHVAPGGRHLLIARQGTNLIARLDDGPAENFCRPSVDPMLRSAIRACDGHILMLMLTGMGQDGLAGTRALIDAGGTAIAQDEASSVVWGMPGAVARAGLCHAVLPLPAMAERAMRLLRGQS